MHTFSPRSDNALRVSSNRITAHLDITSRDRARKAGAVTNLWLDRHAQDLQVQVQIVDDCNILHSSSPNTALSREIFQNHLVGIGSTRVTVVRDGIASSVTHLNVTGKSNVESA